MQVFTSQDPGPLSNSYVVGDRPGGSAIMIDAGTPTGPILAAVEREVWTPQRLFITHRHPDHIAFRQQFVERYGLPVTGHEQEAQAVGGVDDAVQGGERYTCGELEVRVLHIPGHTAGHIALAVRHGEQLALFTGDTLFRQGVGGTRGKGHTNFEDLRHSVLEVLLREPAQTRIYPGHSGPTTVAEELEHNPFVRAWSAPEAPLGSPCQVAGQAAQLLLRGPDYDGGSKCWVRWLESGQLDIVPGSRVAC